MLVPGAPSMRSGGGASHAISQPQPAAEPHRKASTVKAPVTPRTAVEQYQGAPGNTTRPPQNTYNNNSSERSKRM